MNREITGSAQASIYPLQGDVKSEAGNNRVTVTGLQGIPIQKVSPQVASILTYNINANQWQPIERSCILINELPISDDYNIFINATQISLNGTPIA